MEQKTKVIQKDEDIVPVEIIASSIREISQGMKALRAGKLNDKAIIFLVHKASGVASDTVRRVMRGMEDLEKEFLK